jgi:peptide/nickel transport system permease protein
LAILILVVVAIFAPHIAESPQAIDAAATLSRPSAEHWFGTDDLGRDIFSRVVFGARISLMVSICSVAIGAAVGTFLGIVDAYLGGIWRIIIDRLLDALLSFPTIVLALFIVSVLGASTTNVIAAISIVLVPTFGRVIRSSALTILASPYIDAARCMGCGSFRIMFRHVLPNVMAPVIVLATVTLGGAVLAEASLSFLGLGTPPPTPSWGNMLSGSAQLYLRAAPWMAIFPGAAITLLVLGFNLLGDALRDVLDPRLRSGM